MTRDLILLALPFWPIIGAIISYLIGRKDKVKRDYFADAVCISEFIVIAVLFFSVMNGAEYSFRLPGFCVRGLYLKLDGFRVLYSLVAILMWTMTTIFSKEYFLHYRNRNRYYLFLLITFGSTVGVFLSGDLYTTFVFFEIMSMASYVIVIHDEKPGAMRAGDTYMCVAVLGGMVMLMGLFVLYNAVGTLDMDLLLEACEQYEDKSTLYIACCLMLFGFGAKAGMYPIHVWLPKAHPVAPAPASALLSGILTKAGVYGILVISANIFLHDEKWGQMILVFGIINMFLGALLAVFSIDLKRTLACSSMSQIGFILIGVGMQGLLGHHNALAVRGTILHMVNHSLIKLVLFMAAGAIFMNIHKLNLNDIRGFGRGKPLLNGIFLMGVLGIAGVPLWNGYISKTLLHESIVEYIEELVHHGISADFYHFAEWIFLISGGMTAAYMTKLYVCIFWEKHPEKQEDFDAKNGNYMDRESAFALTASAALLPILGFFPYLTMDRIASLGQGFMHGHDPEHAVHYFNFTNLKGGAISLAIGALIYFFVIRRRLMEENEKGQRVYINAWPDWIDLENLIYRPLILVVLPNVGALIARIADRITDLWIWILRSLVFKRREKTEKQKLLAYMREDTEVQKVNKQIIGSLSFSLLLFCAGLVASLLYMLW